MSQTKVCTLACVLKYLNGGKAVRAIPLTHSVLEQFLRQILNDSQWSMEMCRWYQSFRNNYRRWTKAFTNYNRRYWEMVLWRMIWYLIMPNARSWSHFVCWRSTELPSTVCRRILYFPGFVSKNFFVWPPLELACRTDRSKASKRLSS